MALPSFLPLEEVAFSSDASKIFSLTCGNALPDLAGNILTLGESGATGTTLEGRCENRAISQEKKALLNIHDLIINKLKG